MKQHTEADTSRYCQVREGDLDCRVHFNDSGEGGKAVVMMHGSGPGASGWSNFHRNVDAFAAAGYRVLLVDSPGWNKSDPIVTPQRELTNARAVKGVLDHLGIGKASLLGNSMGGASALRMALEFPDRVEKLVLMGGGSGGASLFTPMPTEGLKRLFGLYQEPTRENLERMLDIFVYDPKTLTPELKEGRWNNMMARPEHLRNFVESAALGRRADMTPRLGEIAQPTLITWGRDDRFVPMDLGLKMLWGLPKAEMHVFSQCGHWAQWEHADAFNRLVLDFLAR
jgi:2-hydroxy-6-oxonona-2,4-dienedioate hydrolase